MKTKYFLLLIITAFLNFSIFAQKDEREANYHFKSENYAVSLALYKKLFENDTTNNKYNYPLGISYLKCNSNPKAALKYLLKATLENESDPVFQFNLGKAYMFNHKFKEAKEKFESCKNSANKDEALKTDANTWYKMAENAERMIKTPLDVSFINMGKYINSKMDELTPFVTPDNEFLLYTSNSKYDHKFLIYTYNVLYSNKANGYFKKGKMLTSVNSMDDEYMAGISLTNERIFVQLQGYEGFEDIMYSDRNGKKYKKKLDLMKT